MNEIQLPQEDGHYKIVQLYIDDKPILAIQGPFHKHCGILEEILNEFNIPYEKTKIGGDEIPALKGNRYRVTGMGLLTRCNDLNLVLLSGRSIDYGIGIDKEHIKSCKKLIKEDIKIVVRD